MMKTQWAVATSGCCTLERIAFDLSCLEETADRASILARDSCRLARIGAMAPAGTGSQVSLITSVSQEPVRRL